MPTFGVIADYNSTLSKFVCDVISKFKNSNLLINPFNAELIDYHKVKYLGKTRPYYIIKMEPVYFNYTPFILLSGITLFLFVGPTWWLVPFAVLSLGNFFWNSYFYFLMFKLGARKKGYKGLFKYENNNEIVKRLIFNGSD